MRRKISITPDEIRAVRKRLELTQAEFARYIAVSRDTVASWEAGRSRPFGPVQILIRQIQAQLDVTEAPPT